MTETGTIAIVITLVFCTISIVAPLLILLVFWQLNDDFRRASQLVPAFAERYALRLQPDQGDWFGRWPRATGECGGRALTLEVSSAQWYHRHRGLRLEMAVEAETPFSLHAPFLPDLYQRWQKNQDEQWSPLDIIPYESNPAKLGDWLFVENELFGLKLEEHLSRLYQQNGPLSFTLGGETGRFWVEFPDTRLSVNQLAVTTQILEKFAAALESYPHLSDIHEE